MRKYLLAFALALGLALCLTPAADAQRTSIGILTEEVDGSPAGYVYKLKVPNTSLSISDAVGTLTLVGTVGGLSVDTAEAGDDGKYLIVAGGNSKIDYGTPAGGGDMDAAVWDGDTDGFIDADAGGTDADSSSATGIAYVAAGTWSWSNTLAVNVALDDGSGDSPTLTLQDEANATLVVTKLQAGGASIATSAGGIYLMGGDADDYLNISATSNKMTIAVVGEGGLDIDALNTAADSTITLENSDGTYVANVVVEGDLTVSGDDITMGTNTIGAILVGDGTNFNPVVMGGNATIGADGAVSLADDSVAAAEMADADHGMVSWSSGAATVEDFALNADADAGDYDITSVDKLEGVDTAVFLDLGADGIAELQADTKIQLDSPDVIQYEASNDGNPEYRIGATDTEEARIQAVYDSGAQTLDYLLIQTEAASATADKGKIVIKVDEAQVAQFDDAGLELGLASTLDGVLTLHSDQGHYVSLQPHGTTTANTPYIFPAGVGTTGQYLQLSDQATGQLAWSDPTGTGGDITAVGNFTSGAAFTTGDSQAGILYFEGATANDYEIALASDNPGADYTITLPDQTGHVLLGPSAGFADNVLIKSDNSAADGHLMQATGVTVDDSNNITGVVAITMTGNLSIGSDPADAGTGIRMTNASVIEFEDTEGTGEVTALTVDASEAVIIGDANASGVTITPALTLSSTLTDGTATLNTGAWSGISTISMGDALTLSDGATLDQSANNYVGFTENSDSFQVYFGGTDVDIVWSDGALNLRNNEDSVNAIVEIEGKDAGERGELRVLSDGDDKYAALYHDDTNSWVASSSGNIILSADGDTDDYIMIDTTTNVPSISPDANDGGTLGTSAIAWSDLYLANGAVITWTDATATTLTHVDNVGLSLNLDFRIADGYGLVLGSNQDWDLYYDESGNDALTFTTAATAGAATTTGMFRIVVNSGGGTLTDDQEVLEIVNNTTELLSLDENGNLTIAGGYYAAASTDPAVVLNETTESDTDYWFGINADQEGDNDDYFEVGTGLTAGSNTIFQLDPSGNLTVEGFVTTDSYLHFEGGTYDVRFTRSGSQSETTNYTLPVAYPGASGYALVATTAGVMSWAEITATAGGSDTHVQYNSSGTLAGEAAFAYDAANNRLNLSDGSIPSWGNSPQLGIEGVLEVDGAIYADGGVNALGGVKLAAAAAAAAGEISYATGDLLLHGGTTDSVSIGLNDADCTDNDINAAIRANATTTTSAGEIIDLTLEAQIGGTLYAVAEWDGSDEAWILGDATTGEDLKLDFETSNDNEVTISSGSSVSQLDIQIATLKVDAMDIDGAIDQDGGAITSTHTAPALTLEDSSAEAGAVDLVFASSGAYDVVASIKADEGGTAVEYIVIDGANDKVVIGQATPDDNNVSFAIQGDADSDAADTTEALTFALTPNATPTSSTWTIADTQGAGITLSSTAGTVTVESVVFTGGALSSVASITDGTATWSSSNLAGFADITSTDDITVGDDLLISNEGVISWNSGASTITHSTNTLTVGGSGATTLALGTNNLTMTGSIGATGARVAKGWFTDLESTNAIAGSITGNAATATTATNVVITDNESTAEANAIAFVADADIDGSTSIGLESDGDFTYNPSTGTVSATTFTASTSVITPLIDAAGDEDMDYGSADVDDHTFTSDGGTVVLDGTIAASGGITTGANGADGQLTIYSEQGETDYSVVIQPHGTMTAATTYLLPPAVGTANQVLGIASVDGTTATLEWQNDDSAGSPAWDDIGDPDADDTISTGGYELTLSSTLNEADHSVFTIIDTTADITADSYLLSLEFNDAADEDAFYLKMVSDADGTPATQFSVSGTQISTTLPFVSTGYILGAINIVTTTDGSESPTAAQMYGTMFIADHATATSDTDYTLPSAVAGMNACFYDNGGGAGGIIIDAAAGDEILLDGTGVGTADAIDSPGVAGDGANGDFICIMAIDDTNWITMGRSGTWVDGGAD